LRPLPPPPTSPLFPYTTLFRSPIGQPRRSDNGPRQAAVPKDVLHQSEIDIVLTEDGFHQWGGQIPHEESVPRVVLRRLRTTRRRDGGNRRCADNDNPPYAHRLHRLDDGPRALRRDPGLGTRPWTKGRQHRDGTFD